MKKVIALVALLAGAVGAQAQGTVEFSDYASAFVIDVWSPNFSNPSVEQIGGTATDLPGGNTVYGGVPLGGANTGPVSPTDYGNGNLWSIGLYASTSASIPVNLTTADLVVASHFITIDGTGTANVIKAPAFGGGGDAGSWYNVLDLPIPGTATGNAGSSQIQLAAWYNGGGATSYAAAVAAGVPAGFSQVGILYGLGGFNIDNPPNFSPTFAGLGITSFSLSTGAGVLAVPEPGTVALGIMACVAFLPRLRRKR